MTISITETMEALDLMEAKAQAALVDSLSPEEKMMLAGAYMAKSPDGVLKDAPLVLTDRILALVEHAAGRAYACQQRLEQERNVINMETVDQLREDETKSPALRKATYGRRKPSDLLCKAACYMEYGRACYMPQELQEQLFPILYQASRAMRQDEYKKGNG